MLGQLPFVRRIAQKFRSDFDSEAYWQNRYETGRNSGAGSYGRLAEYKAEEINSLVRELGVQSVLEFGCGDGNQASLFSFSNYTGLDVSPLVVQRARERFADREGWSFNTVEEANTQPQSHDMSMSLDVIYHLVEDEVFEAYMESLFASARQYVLVYASDHAATTASSHVRHRNYSEWVKINAADFKLVRTFQNPFPKKLFSRNADTSFAFFQLFERQAET